MKINDVTSIISLFNEARLENQRTTEITSQSLYYYLFDGGGVVVFSSEFEGYIDVDPSIQSYYRLIFRLCIKKIRAIHERGNIRESLINDLILLTVPVFHNFSPANRQFKRIKVRLWA